MRREDFLRNVLVELIRKSETTLPGDIVTALKESLKKETNEIARLQLKTILDNVKLAREESLPVCQDTGTFIFFIDVGVDFPYMHMLKSAIREAVEISTKKIPLRPNCVDPFTGENTGNTGERIPWIEWNLVEGSDCRITVLPKGAGSENCSTLRMFNPSDGVDEIENFVVNHVIECGGKPCPPVVLGIGIGGGADIAMKLAKKSLLRKIGERNRNKVVADLEKKILKRVNETGIGPMGLGGNVTALDVHIEYASRHPASFPVAISVQCWANRRACVVISEDGDANWI